MSCFLFCYCFIFLSSIVTEGGRRLFLSIGKKQKAKITTTTAKQLKRNKSKGTKGTTFLSIRKTKRNKSKTKQLKRLLFKSKFVILGR